MGQVNKPSIPYLVMIPEMTTTNAPVGPPICVFEPPQRGDQEASNDGAVNSSLRRNSRRDGKSHSERQSHKAHGDAGDRITEEFAAIVVAQ
jgi:hypothetical protein